jgi:hypothetical protein
VSRYEGRECKCDDCGDETVCAEFQGKWYCNYCWHTAREKTQPWKVRRVADHYPGGTGVYTQPEAEDFARELDRRYNAPGRYEAYPADDWYGDRIAHPGYMATRRAAVLAAHPASPWSTNRDHSTTRTGNTRTQNSTP